MALKSGGGQVTAADLEEIWLLADPNGDGVVSHRGLYSGQPRERHRRLLLGRCEPIVKLATQGPRG